MTDFLWKTINIGLQIIWIFDNFQVFVLRERCPRPFSMFRGHYFDGLVQNCSNSIANALELPQSCTKPSIFVMKFTPVHVVMISICINLFTSFDLVSISKIKWHSHRDDKLIFPSDSWRRALSICWIFNPFLFMSHIYLANSASLFFSIPRILLKCYMFQFVCHLPSQALSACSAYSVCSEGGLSSWPCSWHVLEQCQSHGSNALLLSGPKLTLWGLVMHTYLDASVNWVIRQ